MVHIRNSLTGNDVAVRLDGLSQMRGEWERGAYATSNTELYCLLQSCFSLYQDVKGNSTLIKEINGLLSLRGITFNEGTALATKVVRYVFGGHSKRVFTYARVLLVAELEKAENESFSTFITRLGGIEEIRKRPADGSLTKAELTKAYVEDAEKYFVSADALVSDLACASPDVHPTTGAAHQFTAALLRKNDDGTLSIVFGSNKATVVKVLLVEGGKAAQVMVANHALEAQQREARAARDAVINQAQAA
jgi:hypothetical protein